MNFRVKAELSENGKTIDLKFPYHAGAVRSVKEIPGRRYVEAGKGGPAWRVPLNLTTARLLRETFGSYLRIGPELRRWGHKQTRRERNLRSLSVADDAKLRRLPEVLPALADTLFPYQRADVSLMAQNDVINMNQPGLGKTMETIAAVFEAGLDEGAQLVLAPKTSLEVVWQYELERWQEHPVFVMSGDVPKAERDDIMRKLQNMYASDLPFWLVVNHDQLRRRDDLTQFVWKTNIIDEYHKIGLANTGTVFQDRARRLKAERRYLISGTPMGGKPIKLWGGLHWLDPVEYSSKWQWAEAWLDIEDTGWSKEIGGIKLGREDDFYAAHAGRMVRRLKSEVLTDLPPKTHVDVWCPMTPKQRKQYEQFAEEAEVRIEEERLSATSVLAEYTRLKQFANAMCTVDKVEKLCRACDGTGHQEPQGATLGAWTGPGEGECPTCDGTGILKKLIVRPTTESGKLPFLMERLEERGITAQDAAGEEKVIVASQFKGTVNMVTDYLNDQGVPAVRISGDTKGTERARLVREFQSEDGPRVMVIVTTAGGVAITLDRADSVHILDETWDPDDQEQLEDRAHRASRNHQVTVYTYRSKGTVEEAIMQVGAAKRAVNTDVLDLRRQGLRASTRLTNTSPAR